jgi:signal peptidase I
MDFRNIKEFTKDMLKYIFTIFVVIFIIVYIVTIQQVVGSSMQPTISDQDIVILNKVHYRFFNIKRFDVVSLKYNNTKYLIKRVIGLPGDKIEYRDNQLYINGKEVTEGFLKTDATTKDFSLETLGYEKIPDDMYLVLGDNRENSLDSREIGLVKKKDIIGKVSLKIWPINKIKYIE